MGDVPVPEGFLIAPSKAAELLGVTTRTLRRMVEEGEIEPAGVTPGGHRRYDMRGIIQLAQRRAESSSDDV